MDFKEEIAKLLEKHGASGVLEVPPSSDLGDYSFPCFPLAKEKKKAPATIAQELAAALITGRPSWLADAKATGPYVNFYLNKADMAKEVLSKVCSEGAEYGCKRDCKATIVIDYSGPNVGKPMHVGHIASTVIGHSLANAYACAGHKVVSINHIGDWGTQFGSLMAAWKKWGDEELFAKNPVSYLLELYVRWHKEEKDNPDMHKEAMAWFKNLEDGDAEAQELWQRFREANLAYYHRMYERFDIKFDSFNGESFYNDKMEPVIDSLKDMGILEEDQGCLIVKVEGLPPFIAKKSDGATTYALRDLTAIKYRFETYNPTKILYVVNHDQSLHFKQVFDVASRMGFPPSALEHVKFGLLRLPEGKMSTRAGRMVLLEQVFDNAAALAAQIIEKKNPSLKDKEKVAEQVGIAAVIFGYLMNDRQKDVIFDWDRVLDFEGDTGPYVQYTHARACSVLRKAADAGNLPDAKSDLSILKTAKEHELVTLLGQYPDMVTGMTLENKPHVLAQYLLRLAHCYNEFYQQCPILTAETKDLSNARLLLCDCARQVIYNGLKVLGIVPPEEM